MSDEMMPLVSVCMVSYNQEKYIREALDSVLLQKTTFPFEVIVSDDCSKDSTPEILREYERKHKGIVYAIVGEKNVGYPNNQRRSLEAGRGKYIALCDGDDYWTDSYKLQKQIDYMESHPDCAICFHNVMNVHEDEPSNRSLMNSLSFPSELSIEDMISRKWFLPTNSEVFRREYLSFPNWYDSVLHIDFVLNLIISQYGKLHYIPDVMAVYRHTSISVNKQHEEGKWGYMLYHSQTMKSIFEKMKDILKPEYHGLLDKKIGFYELEIKKYEQEVYYENHFVPRLLRAKTYKRMLKKQIRKWMKL